MDSTWKPRPEGREKVLAIEKSSLFVFAVVVVVIVCETNCEAYGHFINWARGRARLNESE